MKKINQKEEVQSRRDFFKKAAKAALPILGVALLVSNPIAAKATEAHSSCTTCYGTCLGYCSGSCGSACSYSCTGSCTGGCYPACSGTCKDSCLGTCYTSCMNTCQTTCIYNGY